MRYLHATVMVLGVVAYLVVLNWEALDMGAGTYGRTVLALVVGWNVLLLITSVLALVDAAVKIARRRTRALATDVLVVKLAAVPFFLLNFLIFAAVGPWAMFLTGPFAVLGIGVVSTLTYLAMLSTSIPGFAAVIALRREHRISTSMTVVSLMLLLIFVLDVVAGILLFVADRRKPITEEERLSRRSGGPRIPGALYVQAAVMLLGVVVWLVALNPTLVGITMLDEGSFSILLVAVWNALLLIVAVLVLIDAIGKLRRRETRALVTGVFIVKLAAVPFFVTNFIILGLQLFGMASSWLAAAFFIGIGIALTYYAMLTTSVAGFPAVVALRRDGSIDRARAALFTVMLAVFVADVAAAILMFVIERRARPIATGVAISAQHEVTTNAKVTSTGVGGTP